MASNSCPASFFCARTSLEPSTRLMCCSTGNYIITSSVVLSPKHHIVESDIVPYSSDFFDYPSPALEFPLKYFPCLLRPHRHLSWQLTQSQCWRPMWPSPQPNSNIPWLQYHRRLLESYPSRLSPPRITKLLEDEDSWISWTSPGFIRWGVQTKVKLLLGFEFFCQFSQWVFAQRWWSWSQITLFVSLQLSYQTFYAGERREMRRWMHKEKHSGFRGSLLNTFILYAFSSPFKKK